MAAIFLLLIVSIHITSQGLVRSSDLIIKDKASPVAQVVVEEVVITGDEVFTVAEDGAPIPIIEVGSTLQGDGMFPPIQIIDCGDGNICPTIPTIAIDVIQVPVPQIPCVSC